MVSSGRQTLCRPSAGRTSPWSRCYLVDRGVGPEAEAAFLDAVGTTDEAPYRLVDLLGSDLVRMSQLVRQYAVRRLGWTDASIILTCPATTERENAPTNHDRADHPGPPVRPAGAPP